MVFLFDSKFSFLSASFLLILINSLLVGFPVLEHLSLFSFLFAIEYAKKILLNVHAGHGLTYESTKKICKIKNISEYNIGHFIISDSIFIGLKNSIKKFKKIIS